MKKIFRSKEKAKIMTLRKKGKIQLSVTPA